MPTVDRSDGLQDFWMNSGIVIAGKTTDRFHDFNNVAEEKFRFHAAN
jgi:hypothetical protein